MSRGVLALALALVSGVGGAGGCGGKADGEHTATVTRGTYGGPTPIVACGGGDGGALDAAPDARDGC